MAQRCTLGQNYETYHVQSLDPKIQEKKKKHARGPI